MKFWYNADTSGTIQAGMSKIQGHLKASNSFQGLKAYEKY